MRLPSRLAVTLAVGMFATAGVAVWSCGTGAVGVQACQSIEYERCQLAPTCTQGFDVQACERFYRDECLVGLANTSDTNDSDLNKKASACDADLALLAGCVTGASDAGTCAQLLNDAGWCIEIDASPSPCNVLLNCPEVLTSCSFVGVFLDDGGATDASDAATTDDDAGDAATD